MYIYIGSGKRLWNSIRKHGKENHKREILEFLHDRESLREREREIVNEDFIIDKKCMNLKLGGEGGNIGANGIVYGGDGFKACKAWWLNNENKEHQKKITSFRKPGVLDKARDTNFKNTGSRNGWKGKHHSENGKKHIGEANSISQLGIRNSQFGKVWIFKDDIKSCISVKKEQLEDYLMSGWIRGRKRNYKG